MFDEGKARCEVRAELICPALMDLLDWNCMDVEPAGATVLLANDKASLFEHAQMLHDRDPRNIETASELAHGKTGLGAQPIENRPARLVSQGLKHIVHVRFGNHVIT